MLNDEDGGIRAATADAARKARPEGCSTCVHGHDLDPVEGSLVVCTPQKKAHLPGYCCTGFRRITLAEIDERAEARFGKPVTAQHPADVRPDAMTGKE